MKNETTKNEAGQLAITKENIATITEKVFTDFEVEKDACPTHVWRAVIALSAKKLVPAGASPDELCSAMLAILELIPTSPSALRQAYWKEEKATKGKASTLAARLNAL